MAYDLEEQESLAQLKAWWDKWGNLTLTIITALCLAFAGTSRQKSPSKAPQSPAADGDAGLPGGGASLPASDGSAL